ncbi:MAG: NADH-quinone oxidoreductase subunit N, partial [Actinobacteria bacterium]|nr:NADH-quinone oxidoreductase subunit N [Actinomycetota bacterium]
PAALVPEAILLAGAVVTLLTGMFVVKSRQWLAWLVALAAAGGSTVAAGVAAGTHRLLYEDSYAIDLATTGARLIVGAATVLLLVLARGRVGSAARETEFYVLILLASAGTVVLAGASDLLLLAVGYLLASIPLYALAGWARDAGGAEATLKTYLLGALMSITMLAGIVVLTGTSGGATTYRALAAGLPHAPHVAVAFGVVAVLGGLAFKIGAVPAHFWVPDAVSGATIPAAAYLTTVPKIGGLLAAFRLFSAIPNDAVDWRLLVAVLAAASMSLGNLAAFTQQSVKRLLAYSTISQVGYLMMAVAAAGRSGAALPALLTYLAAYTVSNVGAFAVLAALPNRPLLSDWRGAARKHPGLVAVLVVCLLGLVGIPPTAVFFGKLTVFTATWDSGLVWLVVIAALNTVASLYYYLRWLAPAVLPAVTSPEPTRGEAITVAADGATPPAGIPPSLRWPTVTAYFCGFAATGVGLVGLAFFGDTVVALMR